MADPMQSLRQVPTKPQDYRGHLNKLLESMTKDELARRLGRTVEWVDEQLAGDPEKDRERYIAGVRRCLENNPGFEREETLKILGVTEGEL